MEQPFVTMVGTTLQPLAYPNGDVFIGSIDTTNELKDAHYICNALGGYNKTIKVNNIV
jgi:hypothetical protein